MEWLSGVVALFLAVASIFSAQTVAYRALPLPALAQREARVMFVGDMMFDRSIRTVMEEKGPDYVFSCIGSVLQEAKMVVGNLEGPITATASISTGSVVASPENFTFTFAPEVAPLLYRHNIRLVNIGNNHILNFGEWGLAETLRYLDEAGVGYFGAVAPMDRAYRVDSNGVPLSFINYNEFAPQASEMIYHITRLIEKEHEAGRVTIVYTHWGEEYAPPPERVKKLARRFADAGAKLVVGSHPHVVQEHEVYDGAHIYYSLGNFVFDQYWNEDVRTGLLLDVTFTADGVASVREIPVELSRDRRTCVKTG